MSSNSASVIITCDFKDKLDSRSSSLHAHPILSFKITRNDNEPNWTPLSPITIT